MKGVERYTELFVNRKDAYALQRRDSTYRLRREEVTGGVVEAHLVGRITCGWYAINSDGKIKWACLDADSEDGLKLLQQVSSRLSELEIPSYIEESREGRGHLWIFTPPIAPRPIRKLLERVAGPELEVFPKQDRIGRDGYGSLVRGPLGIHRKTGERYGFLDPETLEKVGKNLEDEISYLGTVRKVDGAIIAEALVEILDWRKDKARKPRYPVSEVDVVKVAEMFTQLEKRGSYFVGLCPLHPEEHHSFAVYPNPGRRGRWMCFHEYRGGDVVSLYAEIKGISYKEALRELEGMGVG